MVGVENYAFGMVQRSHHLGEIGGIVRCEVSRLLLNHEGPIYFAEVSPLSAKRWMMGGFRTEMVDGKKKVQYPSKFDMVYMAQGFGVDTKDHNVADAFAVARFVGECFNCAKRVLDGIVGDGYIERFLINTGLDGSRVL